MHGNGGYGNSRRASGTSGSTAGIPPLIEPDRLPQPFVRVRSRPRSRARRSSSSWIWVAAPEPRYAGTYIRLTSVAARCRPRGPFVRLARFDLVPERLGEFECN